MHQEPFKVKTTPYSHQVDSYYRVKSLLKQRGGMAILSEQGTGKSKVLIDYLDSLADETGYLGMHLIVAPNVVVENWRDEIAIHSRYYGEHVHILRQVRKKRIELATSGKPGIYVINYEGIRTLKYKGGGKKVIANHHLAKQPWDTVACDEITRINSRSSQQSRGMHDFTKWCPKAKRIGMTGTPITDEPMNIFSIFRFIDPTVFGTDYYAFEHRYAETQKEIIYIGGKPREVKNICGYKNEDELSKKMYESSVRWMKKDCLDLPERTWQTRLIPWDKDQKRIYEDMQKDMLSEIGNDQWISSANAIANLIKLRQITQGWVYTDREGSYKMVCKNPPKLKALKEAIEDSAGQVLVFFTFKADLKIIKEFFDKNKITYAVIAGEVSMEGRSDAAKQIQNGSVRVGLCQTKVTQFGLTLTAASTAIYYSNGFGMEERLQSQDRIHRIGQKCKVTYIDLCMEDSIDVSICKMHRKKVKIAERITMTQFRQLAKGFA